MLFVGYFFACFGSLVLVGLVTPESAVSAVAYGLVIGTSVWAYVDAKQIGLNRYNGALRSPGAVLAFGLLLWMVGMPLYLATRHKLKAGKLQLLDGSAPVQNVGAPASPFGAPQSAVPPPIGQWFYHMNGQQLGPVTKDQLFNMARKGDITRDTMVWTQGMAAWARAEQAFADASKAA